jgi:hypothetical protein
MPETKSEPDFAWAFWEKFRGAPDLVAHIARRAARSVTTARYRCELRVGKDSERFESPEDFLAHATAQGLGSSFRALLIEVAGGRLTARIWIIRRKINDLPWLRQGVVLEVDGTGDCVAARNEIATAVSSGKLLQKNPAKQGESRDTFSHSRMRSRKASSASAWAQPFSS